MFTVNAAGFIQLESDGGGGSIPFLTALGMQIASILSEENTTLPRAQQYPVPLSKPAAQLAKQSSALKPGAQPAEQSSALKPGALPAEKSSALSKSELRSGPIIQEFPVATLTKEELASAPKE